MTCGGKYIRRYWRPLLARWALFAAIGFVVGLFTGLDLRTHWPLIIVASGVLNLAWTSVA